MMERWVIHYEAAGTKRRDLVMADDRQEAEQVITALMATGSVVSEERYVFGNERKMCSFFCLSLDGGAEKFISYAKDYVREAFCEEEDPIEWKKAKAAIDDLAAMVDFFGEISADRFDEVEKATYAIFGLNYSDVDYVSYDNVGSVLYVRQFSL